MPRHLTKRSPSPGGGGPYMQRPDDRINESNRGHQMMQKMGWKGSGLGSGETGIVDPISGGEVRDRADQYKGVGVSGGDPFESFRKQRSGAFYTRMRSKEDERKESRRQDEDDY